MKSLLAEQPLLVSLMLGILAGALLFAWLQTGKKAMAIAGLVMLLLIPVAWWVASRWVTDREQIEALIYETAAAVERNDVDAVCRAIGDAKAAAMARAELPRYVFDLARVHQIRSIDIIEGTYPVEADVDMSVKADVSSKSGSIRNVRVLRRLLLKLEKRDSDWVVTDYQHMPVIGGPDQFSPQPTP